MRQAADILSPARAQTLNYDECLPYTVTLDECDTWSRGKYARGMIDPRQVFLEKAEENLAAAESEFANRRYNSCANRCYYACFQAAIYALRMAGIQPPGRSDRWGHDFVQAQFNGQLIGRRKLYPSSLRNTLAENYALREAADYTTDHATERKTARAVRRVVAFLAEIRSETGRG